MKKIVIGAAVVAAGFAALRRFAPAIHQRAMNKCHQMMSKCGEMFGQQAGSPAGTGCMTAATPDPGQAPAGEPEPAQATQAI
jgi:hypothetical protein